MSQCVGNGPAADRSRIDFLGPVWGMIAARMAWGPEVLLMSGSSTQVIGIKFVEAGSTYSEFFGGNSAGQFAVPKGGENFTNQRCAQPVRKLAIMFFIAANICEWQPNNEPPIPALRAFCRPSLRSGLPQARRAGKCPPLLAHLSGFERTLFAFARNATC